MKAAVSRFQNPSGFTLIELMLSVGLISLIAVILVSMTNSTASTWRYTTGRIEQFRGANTAFEGITRRLSQATLNTYWDYDNPTAPKKYFRQSDLRFITGNMTVKNPSGVPPLLQIITPRRPTQGVFFQAPLGYVKDTTNFSGLGNLINTWGYYVEFDSDQSLRPTFLPKDTVPYRYRYRLMELMQPSDSLYVYGKDSGGTAYNSSNKWFSEALNIAPLSHVLAENVIALVLQPKLSKKEELASGKSLTKDYAYDSNTTNPDPVINPKSQLPPIVQVTLMAIDEGSASRIANGATPPPFDALLDTLFQDVAKYDADLATLQTSLTNSKPPINFRVFTSSVSIRGAKWSRN